METTAVQTEKKAVEILENWAKFHCLDDQGFCVETKFTAKCECGKTQCVRASIFNLHTRVCDLLAFITVCNCCGNDSAFEDEVLRVR